MTIKVGQVHIISDFSTTVNSTVFGLKRWDQWSRLGQNDEKKKTKQKQKQKKFQIFPVVEFVNRRGPWILS